MLLNLYYDYKLALNQIDALQEANDLNQQKNRDINAQYGRLEEERDKLFVSLEDIEKERDTLQNTIDSELQGIKDDKGKAVVATMRSKIEQLRERYEFYKELAAKQQERAEQLEAQEQADSQEATLELTILRNDIADLLAKNKDLEDRMAQLTRRDLSLFSRRRLTTNVGNNGSGERDPLPSKDGNGVDGNGRRSDAFGF